MCAWFMAKKKTIGNLLADCGYYGVANITIYILFQAKISIPLQITILKT